MSESTPLSRQKRLGQFYTGVPLAKLLAAFCDLKPWHSVIDPMAGSGDLLVACAELGVSRKNLFGVEIDPLACDSLKSRLPQANCVNASAFNVTTYNGFKIKEWDVVIANPPYVRYQSGSRASFEKLIVPSAEEVRTDLISLIKERNEGVQAERELVAHLASSYSGLSDLAVPSWLLCASLVKSGGRLALVVPESWLNRDYASVINYLLLRSFTIECVITDDHAVWFPEAQVKTTLIVARKTAFLKSAVTASPYQYLKVGLQGEACRKGSPISKLNISELKFAAIIRSKTNLELPDLKDLVEIQYGSSETIREKVLTKARSLPWLKGVEPADVSAGNASFTPDAVKQWLRDRRAKGSLKPLSQAGVSISQGLRTGANKFFYITHLQDDGASCLVKSALFGGYEFEVPRAALLHVIRKQSDLHDRQYWQPVDASSGRVLVIKRLLERPSSSRISKSLSGYIKKGEVMTYEGTGQSLPSLSAVRSNIQKDTMSGAITRDWYMLPELSPRHMPDIIVPRVVGERLRAFALKGRKVVVDANFTTIRINKAAVYSVPVVLAVLNSSWARTVIEHTAAVMGAGALKVEASHLKNFPMPDFDARSLSMLARLGEKIDTDPNNTLEEINRVVLRAVLGRSPKAADLQTLEQLALVAEKRRFSHKHYK